MKNRNTVFIAIVFALAFALASVTEAAPRPGGGPGPAPAPAAPNEGANANSAYSTNAQDEQSPVIKIYSTGDVSRGKTGSFVLSMSPAVMFGGTYINFSVSGTAIPGVDYVPLISPAYIGSSGYGVILVQTLPDPRAPSIGRAYDVIVTLEPGVGYAVGETRSAKMTIKP